ncbi:non-ribosomal peptide synthetase [Nostoc sp. ATCC 43529]|nr:non-ribosomal peptide synthetase [Nostoc sp. ATCC 43529]
MSKSFFELPVEFSTLVELLHWRASKQPQQQAYTFLVDGEVEGSYLTYGELDRQARLIATLLQSCAKRGERALLLYPPGLEFIAAFFGCLYAGVIAVPAYPPRSNRSMPRLQAIIADAQATIVLTTTNLLADIKCQFHQVPELATMQCLATDEIAREGKDRWQQADITNNTLALLQYTSGSTAAPKGVKVSHGNLLHNQKLIQLAMEHTAETVFVGWLPLFHDMGLVGNMLQPLYLGIPCILMSPVAFLQKPWRWLQAISRYKATTSGGPNFAYDLCVRKITPEQRTTLDLSSWEIAFNGAEPIRKETLEQFAATFAECGFRREAFYPCYGMAETTLILSGGSKAAPPVLQSVKSLALAQNQIVSASTKEVDVRTLVGCGRPLPDLKIVIVNPDTLIPCLPSEVGEIWVAGGSVTQGYWCRTEQTEYTFRACLKDTKEEPFLRTGDLGFLYEGELFITGRLKDLIIIRGRNHYPQDIEWTVAKSHPALQADSGAAFSVDVNGEERLVIVQEVQRSYLRNLDPEELLRAIRQAVVEEHQVQVYAVLLLKPSSIPKTSSGKIQRHACRAGFLAGTLETIASCILEDIHEIDSKVGLSREDILALQPLQRQSKLESYLQQQVARVMKVSLKQVNPRQPLGSLGVDSLIAIELQHTFETDLGVVLPMACFLGNASLEQLAIKIIAQLESNSVNEVLSLNAVTEYQLSHGQQALYFLQQLAPENTAYNIARAVLIRGDLNIEALHRAFQILADRHPVLRTTFITKQGQTVQRVHQQLQVYWQQEDASEWDELSLSDRLIQLAHSPFDLQQGPLIRVGLFIRSPQEHILLLVVHHIVADLWSLTVLVDELGRLYEAEKNSIPLTLPPLTKQYADYVNAEAQMLASPEGEKLWAYWQKQLAGELPVLNLHTDRPRPFMQSYRGATYTCKFSAELTQKLKDFSRDRQVTLYMTLLAAFQSLLYRYTGQEDILVGSPTSGRNRAAWGGVVGYLVNPVVLRANFADNPSFETFLQQVQQTVLDAFAHQDYPFSLIVEQLVPVRDLGRSPLFQVMFVLQKAQIAQQAGLAALALGESGIGMNLGDLQLETWRLEQQIAQFELTLMMAENDGVLTASWQYNSDLFDSDTITRIAGHFQTLLESAIANPLQPIANLPLLTDSEQHQILSEFSQPQSKIRLEKFAQRGGTPLRVHHFAYAGKPVHRKWFTARNFSQNPKSKIERCLHELFTTQVEQTPDAVAITFADEHLTYQQLNARANQLAHYLQSLGVKPEVKVGLCVERSLEMIVGILGILKAGGAYVPLDPNYPQERLVFILEDANITIVVTQKQLIEKLPTFTGSIVCLDRVKQEREHNPISEVTADNLAYIIYTSGSTGQPKGVLVNHFHVVRLFSSTDEWFKFSNNDVWTQFHSYAFDFSVWEMWGALLYGGRLVIVPYWISRSPEAFYNLLCQEQVTVLNQTPSAFRQLMRLEQQASKLALRLVIFGGEALEIKTLKPWFDRHGDSPQLVNMYGITETTVHVTYHPLTKADIERTNSIIGRPIPDLQVYILDKHRQLVPVGVPGEMYVGGAGVTRGYLNRPELTAARFRHCTFGNYSTRLYQTGDLGRYLPNGELEYLGRIDEQVKVRGFRIELGEIEAVLRQHPAIEEAVVLMRETEFVGDIQPDAAVTELRQFIKQNKSENFSDRQLIAYCVSAQQPTPTITELRRWLKNQLPEYMIPAAFVMLDSLPLTPNGKVDKRVLPNCDRIRPDLDTAYIAPTTSAQKALAQIWTQVLRIERVGIYDNFFELGGDSIRSIQVLAKSQERGLNFSLQQLFQHQTIYELVQEVNITEPSSLLTQKTEKFSLITASDGLRPAVGDRQKLPLDIEDAYPLARIQAGVIFHSQYSPDSPMYHDIFFYQLRVRFDVECLQQAIQQLVNRHPILRTSFDLINFSEPLQLVHERVSVPLQVEDLRFLSPTQQKQAIDTWIETEKQRNFDWTCPPMIRFFIHRLTDESFYLVLSFHDCILDGWSTASLLTELLHRYWALLHNQTYPLDSSPTITYRDFVALERSTLKSEECRNYWTQKLQDCITIQLPRWDCNSPSSANPEIGVLNVPISSELSDRLKQLAKIAQVPVKHVLLAAHIRVMSLLSGETDVLTGLESNGRLETEDGEQTLGIHLNTVPLRLQLDGGTWIDLVQQTFQAESELLPYRRYPYAELKKLNRGEQLFETVFNYTHFHIFQNLQSLIGLEIVGAQGFGETHFALRVEFNREPFSDNIQLDLECDLTKINQAQLEAIGSYYFETLTAMSQQPSDRYESQCLLPVNEQHQLLIEWNHTSREYPESLLIHQWFVNQALQTPDATALVFGDQQLTYQELNERSNQLAHYLQSLGVSCDVPVGLYIERSLEMIVGILGILKAGGAYVPLDPAYPQEHINLILQDAGVSLVVSQKSLVNSLGQMTVICLDTDWELITTNSQDKLINCTEPNHLAYIIYTSGSTGNPKGVPVTHKNLVHSTSARIAYYSEPVRSFLLIPSFAFDSSVAVIFWTLCQGGTLILINEGRQRDIWHLRKAIAQHQISHWLSVPSLYALLLDHIQPAELNSLRTVIVAGETCSPALVKHHRQLLPQASLFNEYGPTEATVWSSVCNCQDYESSHTIPIGRPISNTQIYLLDIYLQPVPVGVIGEIYISGEGVVSGYLNHPELTAQKFIPNPFEKAEGKRLYKTGDLGRFLPDGNIEFIGRRDYQVKINGYRIELEEIETVLKQHPGVKNAVVLAREELGKKYLLAYVVTCDIAPSTSQLRNLLKQKLPAYKIPNSFIILDTLPLTPNGKVDRRNLPAPNQKLMNEMKIAHLLQKLEQISDEEAQLILAQKKMLTLQPE